MSAPSGPDLSDPLVLRAAASNHVPEELWAREGRFIGVVCMECHLEWPCGTRLELRRLAAGEGET